MPASSPAFTCATRTLHSTGVKPFEAFSRASSAWLAPSPVGAGHSLGWLATIGHSLLGNDRIRGPEGRGTPITTAALHIELCLLERGRSTFDNGSGMLLHMGIER